MGYLNSVQSTAHEGLWVITLSSARAQTRIHKEIWVLIVLLAQVHLCQLCIYLRCTYRYIMQYTYKNNNLPQKVGCIRRVPPNRFITCYIQLLVKLLLNCDEFLTLCIDVGKSTSSNICFWINLVSSRYSSIYMRAVIEYMCMIVIVKAYV